MGMLRLQLEGIQASVPTSGLGVVAGKAVVSPVTDEDASARQGVEHEGVWFARLSES